MKKSQLRAISYAITKRDQAKAVDMLEEKYGLDFEDFSVRMRYNGSPIRLLGDLDRMSTKAWNRLAEYADRYGANVGVEA